MIGDMKLLVKKLLYPIQCLRYGLKHHEGFLYIGKGTKIVNPKNIHFGNAVSIMPYSMIVGLGDHYLIKIGKNTEIGMFSRIGCVERVEIGDNVLTGPHVFIADYNHEYRNPDIPIKNQGNAIKACSSGCGVFIGSDTWLGTNVVISGSIHIGKHCVIGANSVVATDIPDYCVAVGVPCRVVKKYDFSTGTWIKQ